MEDLKLEELIFYKLANTLHELEQITDQVNTIKKINGERTLIREVKAPVPENITLEDLLFGGENPEETIAKAFNLNVTHYKDLDFDKYQDMIETIYEQQDILNAALTKDIKYERENIKKSNEITQKRINKRLQAYVNDGGINFKKISYDEFLDEAMKKLAFIHPEQRRNFLDDLEHTEQFFTKLEKHVQERTKNMEVLKENKEQIKNMINESVEPVDQVLELIYQEEEGNILKQQNLNEQLINILTHKLDGTAYLKQLQKQKKKYDNELKKQQQIARNKTAKKKTIKVEPEKIEFVIKKTIYDKNITFLKKQGMSNTKAQVMAPKLIDISKPYLAIKEFCEDQCNAERFTNEIVTLNSVQRLKNGELDEYIESLEQLANYFDGTIPDEFRPYRKKELYKSSKRIIQFIQEEESSQTITINKLEEITTETILKKAQHKLENNPLSAGRVISKRYDKDLYNACCLYLKKEKGNFRKLDFVENGARVLYEIKNENDKRSIHIIKFFPTHNDYAKFYKNMK